MTHINPKNLGISGMAYFDIQFSHHTTFHTNFAPKQINITSGFTLLGTCLLGKMKIPGKNTDVDRQNYECVGTILMGPMFYYARPNHKI